MGAVAGRGATAGFLLEQRCQRARVPLEDLLLAGAQCGAGDDRAGERGELLPRLLVVVAEEATRRADEAPDRLQDALAGGALADGVAELLLERLQAPVNEVFLRREVVEHRLLGDLGLARDLGDGDAFEAPLGEPAARDLGDQLARVLLLALA